MSALARTKFVGSSERNFLLGIVLVLSFLVLVPLGQIVVTSARNGPLFMPGVFDFSGFQAFTGSETLPLIANTLIYSLLGVAMAFAISLPLTWLVERTDMPGRAFWRIIIISMMALPPGVAAVAWTMLLSPRIGAINILIREVLGLKGDSPLNIYSLWGMALVSGTVGIPSVFLMVGPTFRQMSRELEEASQASGAPVWRMIQTVTLPLARPAIVAAFLYVFVVLIGAFDTPGIIGTRAGIIVFSNRLFWALHPPVVFPEYHVASALSISFVAVAGLLIYLYLRAHKRAEKYAVVVGKGSGAKLTSLGRWRWPAFAFCSLSIFIAMGLPLLILVWTSLQDFYMPPSLEAVSRLSLDSYRNFLTSPRLLGVVKNTLILMPTSATFAMVLAFFVSWAVVRVRSRVSGFINVVSFLPVGMPAIVVATAVMLTYLFLPLPIYGTIWIIAIAHTTKFLAYSSNVMKTALMQIHKELEEASHASGASLYTTLTRVTLPLLLPAMASGWIWVAAHSLRDLTMAATLMSRHNIVLASYVWVLWEEGFI